MTHKRDYKAFLRTDEEIAQGIVKNVEILRSAIKAIAEKRVTMALPTMRHDQLRFAPHYAIGLGKDEPGTVPYSLASVATGLGSVHIRKTRKDREYATVSRWMRLAMMLLEAEERGTIGPETYERILRCEPGYKVKSLLKRLSEESKAFKLMKVGS